MADRKITDLTALAAGSQATGDLLTIVDVSEAAAVDKNKKITVESLFKGIPGNVGIGTTAPNSILTTKGSFITLQNSSGSNVGLLGTADQVISGGSSSNFGISTAGGELLFGSGGTTERARIDSSGRLLVGTSTSASSNSKLQVHGDTNNLAELLMAAGNADGPALYLSKSRGSVGSPSEVSSGDSLGSLIFQGYDGATWKNAAYIQAIADGSWTDGGDTTDNPSRLTFSTTADGSSSPTERMRLDSSGRLGIGTTSVSSLLHLYQATGSDAFEIIEAQSSGNNAGLLVKTGGNNLGYFAGAGSFSGAAANLAISAPSGAIEFRNGVSHLERARIDSSGRLGIGTTGPQAALNIKKDANSTNPGDSASIVLTNKNTTLNGSIAGGIFADCYRDISDPSYTGGIWFTRNSEVGNLSSSSDIVFGTTGSGNSSLPFERARLDSSGRLLVGTSSSPSAANGSESLFVVQGYVGGSTANAQISLQRGEAASTITANEGIGNICFADNNGNAFSYISCFADGTAGTNDYPGRLTFSTTADGASSPTERMRLDSRGYLKVSNGGTYWSLPTGYHELGQTANLPAVVIHTNHATYASQLIAPIVARAANSVYQFFYAYSGNGTDVEFNLRGDGNGYCDGSWNGGGADYAEYFEWSDSNPDAEDRRGISVVLDGNKIREAVTGEDPIGVISGNPSVVGDAAWNKWSGKYLRDEFGSYLLDENGDRQLSPAFNPDVEYVSREQRPEWDCVGLMGKIRIRKGQVTGSRWIKMRDINDSVEEWLVR